MTMISHAPAGARRGERETSLTPRTAGPSVPEAAPAVCDVSLTATCGLCGGPLPAGRARRWCSDACKQAAFRLRRSAPRAPLPGRADTVYECPECEARYLVQRCEDCNRFCRRLGPGGPCPHCDELVVLDDILGPDQLVAPPATKQRTRAKERP
jgi:hypothetical protein